MADNSTSKGHLLARSSLRLFAALGIAPTSDPATLRAAFAVAARRHHPDKGGDAAAFAEASAAYEELMRTATERGFPGEAAAAAAATAAGATSPSSSLSRHASVARTAAASLASGPPVAAELDLDECERFSEEEEEEKEEKEEEEEEEEEEEGDGDGSGGGERQEEAKKRGKRFFYSYPCRCGGAFVVAEADLRAECCEVLVPCDGCSSKVRVLYKLAGG